jgi:hypothetical protein
MKYRPYWITFGFLLFFLGITSLVMQLVNVYWYFLRWLELGGGLTAFILKMLMVIVGILIFVLARTDWEQEIAENQ